MALMPQKLPQIVQKKALVSEKNDQLVKYSFNQPEYKTHINMKNIEWLLSLQESHSKEAAHEIFMKNYRKIFEKHNYTHVSSNRNSLVPSMLLREKNQKSIKSCVSFDEQLNVHDIKRHLEEIHGKKIEPRDQAQKKNDMLKKLRKLVKKMPYERNHLENKKIYDIMTKFGFLSRILPDIDDYNYEKLCSFATFESCSSKQSPVFGNHACYLILRGKVKPLSDPHLNTPGTRLRAETPEPSEDIELLPGDCFGTLTELQNREMTTTMFRVTTLEENCEFLKITINDYKKLLEKVRTEKREEKQNVIRNCVSYENWPKHAVDDLMNLIEWVEFPANTIITSEGFRSPFIGYFQKGSCHVLRKVDVRREREDGSIKYEMKQVVIGKLQAGQSFGELSVILQEPMTCSIVTETECRLGLIHYEKIYRLDDITRRLLIHSNTRNFSQFTQEDIHKLFIDQELKKEWLEYKNLVVKNVIDKYGIF